MKLTRARRTLANFADVSTMVLTRRQAAAAKRGDWAWLSEDLLGQIVTHAELEALPTLARLDRRSRQASAERLGRLAVLTRPPFVECSGRYHAPIIPRS